MTETLDLLEAAANECVIVSTPNSPLYRPGHETPLGFNACEAHVSYVSRSLLADRGFCVYGAGFGRYNSRLALAAKGWGIRKSLTSVAYRIPAIAESIVAVKDVR